MTNSISAVEVLLDSEEAIIAFYSNIQPRLMHHIDNDSPDLSSRAFDGIGEDGLFMLFVESCKRNGYGMVRDIDGGYSIAKIPESTFVASKIFSQVELYCKEHSVGIADVNKVSEHGKSIFLTIAMGCIKKSSGTLRDKNHGKNSFVFQDGSLVSISEDGQVGVTAGAVQGSKDSFKDFALVHKLVIEQNLSESTTLIM